MKKLPSLQPEGGADIELDVLHSALSYRKPDHAPFETWQVPRRCKFSLLRRLCSNVLYQQLHVYTNVRIPTVCVLSIALANR